MFSEPLRGLVTRKFLEARARKDIIFSDTQLAVLQNSYKTPIQLRYCPALAKKPEKGNPPGNKGKPSSSKPFDPFEDPAPELLVAAIPTGNATHNIVLNKYPVIPNHFILATKDNKPQTHLLESDDLYLSHACLRAWEDAGHSLFAFFNSGEHSGASQPHRHVQFLPVEDMEGEAEGGNGDAWGLLCNTMNTPAHPDIPLLHNPALPIVHFAVSLEDHASPRTMLDKYLLLLKAAFAGISGNIELRDLDEARIQVDGRTTFSYNLAMTSTLMAILPRREESSRIPNVNEGSVAINGTILAGTMMVKAEDEWSRLRQHSEIAQQILRDISFPRAQAQTERNVQSKENL